MQQEEQKFLTDLGKYICTSTNTLRSTLDVLQCKHSAEHMRETVTPPYSNKHKQCFNSENG